MDVDRSEPTDSSTSSSSGSLDVSSSLSSDHSATAEIGSAASSESTAKEKPAVYVIEELPWRSHPPAFVHDIPNRRFTHMPVRRVCETHPNLRRRRSRGGDLLRLRRTMRSLLGRASMGRCPHFGRIETLFDLPVIAEDNVVIFSKPQKLKRSVDEVDQLMQKLDLHIEKSKVP